MSVTEYVLLGISIYIITIVLIVVVLNYINKKEHKKYSKEITNLERNKNLIISASIISELNKVESLINNDAMREVYDDWQVRFKTIKDQEVPKITDELIEIEDLYNDKKYNELKSRLNALELEINFVKSKANGLLDEIKEITLSEENNRETITKLKTLYREILNKFRNNKEDYKDIESSIEIQFENVDKLFSAFEITMDNSNYQEVGKIVKAIDDLIGNLNIIIEEAPSIILMSKYLIPKKTEELRVKSSKLIRDGFNLDYLNLDYNIEEIERKVADIVSRLNVLNVEDSIFELKTIMDYYEGLYNDFDKEKIAKKVYEDYARTIILKTKKLQKINNELHKKIDSIKFSYDLTDDDVVVIDDIKTELDIVEKNYESIVNAYRSKSFAFSKISKEMELLNVRLAKTEDKLEFALRTLGSLKEDELRAREQLDEIKDILKKSKNKINSYKLPVVPKRYYIELSEASMAIKEMIKELDAKPISIKILNTRVDTARDLVLKLFCTTNEVVKTAAMAEMAIVYGNRYRPVDKDLEIGLTKAEHAFTSGNFKLSLEQAISAIDLIEPGIHERLLQYSQK